MVFLRIYILKTIFAHWLNMYKCTYIFNSIINRKKLSDKKNKAIALQEQIVLSVGRFFSLFQPSIASALGIIPLPLHRYRLMKQDGADDNPIRTPRFLHTYQRLDIRNIYKIQSILSPLSFSLSQLLILSFLNVMHIKHYQRYKRLTYHFLNTS